MKIKPLRCLQGSAPSNNPYFSHYTLKVAPETGRIAPVAWTTGETLELIILGTSASYPQAGKACSGYLIKSAGSNLLIDLGSGVLGNLQQHIDPRDLDAIILSHLHPDHFTDIFSLLIYLEFPAKATKKMQLFAPPGSDKRLAALSWANSKDPTELFEFIDLAPSTSFDIASFIVTTAETEHAEKTFAVRVEDRTDGASLTYTADTGPSPQVEGLARGTDLLLAEATWLKRPDSDGVGHLSATEAGELAQRAQAHALILTHLGAEVDVAQAVQLAKSAFGKNVGVATEGDTFLVGQ